MSYEKKKLLAYQNKHSHTVHLALGEDYIKVASINNDCAPEQPLIAAELVKRWNAYPDLVAALKDAAPALDTLADDAEEAGYPARAHDATVMAMNIRALLSPINT